MKFFSKRPPFWASIFTILGVILLCKLGFWQIERLHWKIDLIKQIEHEYTQDAAKTPLSFDDFHEKILIKRGFITGHFLHGKSIALAPRLNNSQPGSHILTPFFVDSWQAYILVNRGWVPAGSSGSTDFQNPEGTLTLIGSLRHPEKPSRLILQNKPAQNQWSRLDLDQISEKMDLDLMKDRVFYIESTNDTYPYAHTGKIILRNDHKNYAIFWFSMAGVLCVIYVLRFFYDRLDPEDIIPHA